MITQYHTNLYYYLDTGPAPPVDMNASPRERVRGMKNGAQPHRLSGVRGEVVIGRAKDLATPPARLVFNLSGHQGHIGLLGDLMKLNKKSGWLSLDLLSLTAFELAEYLIFNLYDQDGHRLNPEIGPALFQLEAEVETEGGSENPLGRNNYKGT